MTDEELLEACFAFEMHTLHTSTPEKARSLLPQYFVTADSIPTNWSPITVSDSDQCEESDPELQEQLLFEKRENQQALELLREIRADELRSKQEEALLAAYVAENPWNPYRPRTPPEQ